MSKILLIVIGSLFFSSCGEIGEEVNDLVVVVTTTKVANATSGGITVSDPSGTDTQIILYDGFFEFSFLITNANEANIIFENFTVQVLDGETVLKEKDFIPQAYLDNTNPSVADPGDRFFAHLESNYDETNPVYVGGQSVGKFYIDGLPKDEDGAYKYTVRFTMNGFITDTAYVADSTDASYEDPYLNDQGIFKRIAVVSTK